MKPSKPFDETLHRMLKDPELAALYLEDCLEDGDMELFTMALRDVADARGGMSYSSDLSGGELLPYCHRKRQKRNDE
jgi:DNA-binding phage protein